MTEWAGSVMTVRGPISPARLGYTLMHEHTEISLWEIEGRYDYGGQFNDADVLAAELARYHDAGGASIVDLTVDAIGRDPERIRALSERTDVNIVMGCGWYRQPYYPAADRIDRRSTDDLARALVEEFVEGVQPRGGGERIRPGIIGEIGADNPWISPAEERVHRAAARAARATGMAINTHSIGGCGPAQLELLLEEGVRADRIVIGHADDAPSRDYAMEIASTGASVAFDRVGNLEPYLTERSADLIVELFSAGRGGQVIVSQDVCMRRQLHCMGGNGYTYVQDEFEGMLRARGLGDDELATILVRNPARILTLEPPEPQGGIS